MKLAIALIAVSAAAVAADSYLIRGVAIHPITQPDIAIGSILIQDGKIAAIGARIVAPKGVRVIDGKGLHAYPGMIDSATEIGVTEIGSVRETNDTGELGDLIRSLGLRLRSIQRASTFRLLGPTESPA